ncbi:hypothetical protein ETU09_00630 [Apibacter muscae]|uniref:Uncharacterized protein n=1 Tax=Apibacter muscae TaxID=2509004 RepID=A0A563DKA5_9FLAO|nr:hypothetical protein [Apibacter muscae]TWP30539.1 hypothetical protein ETU09_00630 [Apibacter muscae]
MTTTQFNFCRLTGIPEEIYQTILFECGYLYAENYCKHLPEGHKENHIRSLRSLSEYWNWWKTQWNIRTQEAFGITGIKQNESNLRPFEIEVLKEAFYDTHCENSYQNIYPNNLVMKALREKIYGNRNNTIKTYSIKGMERNRTRKSSVSVKL